MQLCYCSADPVMQWGSCYGWLGRSRYCCVDAVIALHILAGLVDPADIAGLVDPVTDL